MAVAKILVILAMLAVVRGSSIMRKLHRSADESVNYIRNAHNEDKRLQGQRRQAGLHGRLQADVFQFHVETAPENYWGAQIKCRDKGDGWDLAVLNTKEKWEAIQEEITGHKKQGYYWIGISELKSKLKDKWVWLTGEPLKELDAGGRLHFLFHFRCRILSTVDMYNAGEIIETNCNQSKGYICAKN